MSRQFKCLLSPAVKIHIFRTYVSPVLRTGLSTFTLRNCHIKSLSIFHRKILRGILNFSKSSCIAPLHFLFGELPIEGQIHRDVFSLFYGVWTNSDTKIYQIVKYLLQSSSLKSRTWSVYVRHLASRYDLTDPLEYLNTSPPTKNNFKEHVITKITSHYEKELREAAKNNSRMKFLNISVIGLRGRHHPAIRNIFTPYEVKKCRIHLKMLCGDFLTYELRAAQSGGSPLCRICMKMKSISIVESTEHIISSCSAYDNIRSRIFPEYDTILKHSISKLKLDDYACSNYTLCQFILDPTSLNLKYRMKEDDETLEDIFKLSRDLCFSISNERGKYLQYLTNKSL